MSLAAPEPCRNDTQVNGTRFETILQSTFKPFLEQLNFVMQPIHLSGRYYHASFADRRHSLVITHEPGDDFSMVMLVTNGNEDIRSIDDPEKTPRLSNLNERYMKFVSKRARDENEAFFGKMEPLDEAERVLLKSAQDLRLVLPHHLSA